MRDPDGRWHASSIATSPLSSGAIKIKTLEGDYHNRALAACSVDTLTHSALNHRPLVLDEVEEGLRAAKAAVPPDVLQVFRKVLGYVWPPSLKERLLLVLSIAFLVLAKALNVCDSVSGWAPWGWLSA